MKVKSEREVAQSCPTLSDPMDCSLPGSSIHGIFQAKYWSGVPLPSLAVNPKGNQFGILIGKTDAEAEAPILWSSDAKNQLIGKDSDAGKD